jgi:hypothetical protein
MTVSVAEIIIQSITNRPKVLIEFPYFATLFNEILPNNGVQCYCETIDNGFILFFGSIKDYKYVFPKSKQKKRIEFESSNQKLYQSPMNWYILFKKIPHSVSEDELVAQMKSYWESFHPNIQMNKTSKMEEGMIIYELSFPSVEIYLQIQRFLIEFMKKHPNIIAN